MVIILTGMTGVKDWLQNRFGSIDLLQTLNSSQTDKRRPPPLGGVITPQSIPDFVIPATGSDALHLSHSLGDVKLDSNNYDCVSMENSNYAVPRSIRVRSIFCLKNITISCGP